MRARAHKCLWTPFPGFVVCYLRNGAILSFPHKGTVVPAVTSFAELGLPRPVVQVLERAGIKEPLPIQSATIIDALSGRDVAGQAPTGSGKTLAFAIPMAAKVPQGLPRRPRGLVLVPTRELALQIGGVLAPLLASRGRTVHTIYGGVSLGGQRSALRRGVDVLVACPGRLEDLVSRRDVFLTDVDMVVVDEADRMADMGFLPAVRRILDATAVERQTLLFSATLDGDVEVLSRRYQEDPARHIVAATLEEAGRTEHIFREIDQHARVAACAELAEASASTIVFVRTKHGADRVAKQLVQAGVRAEAIHGGRTQAHREKALVAFRAGSLRALVATDVAARGIHVDNVATVIHFDLPEDPKDYVHRSGRTARAGAEGTVYAFVTPDKRAQASKLQRALGFVTPGQPAVKRHGRPETAPGRGGRPKGRAVTASPGRRSPRWAAGDRRATA